MMGIAGTASRPSRVSFAGAFRGKSVDIPDLRFTMLVLKLLGGASIVGLGYDPIRSDPLWEELVRRPGFVQ